MLLTLLNSNKEKIAFLSNITECNLTQQINEIDKLEFTMPYADKKSQLIEEEMFIQTENDMYVIKALEINAKEIRCECRQDTELLSSKLHNNGFTSLTATISDTLNLAFLGTGYVVHTMGILKKKRTLKLASTNALDILFTAVKKFGFEFRINSLTKVVTIAEEFGVDKGTYFSDQLNAEEINLTTDTLDFATRLYARGKDGLTFADINGGKDYVENYSYSTKIVNKYWEDNRYTVKEDLLEDATKKLDSLCKPQKSYSVSILDLASLKAEYNYLSFGLGDSITLINSKNKYRDKQRIVEINRDLINVHNISVTLANNLLTFEQLQERNEETSEVVEEIVNEDNTISGEKLEDKTVTNNKLAIDSITAENIKTNSITSDKILAGAITSAKIEAGAITAGSSIIADGAIGDAQISKLSATKLSAGIIDASYIEVKNLNAENITVGSINGERIKNGAIDNSKVADNANISGSKLNINDVIVNINGASTQINGTKIQVGDRTLDAELSTQKIINNNTTETISKQASTINALDNAIKLKVDNQTYTSDVQGINTKLNKNTTSIDLLQNAISLKVSQTDVDTSISNIQIGGRNLITKHGSWNNYPPYNTNPTMNGDVVTFTKNEDNKYTAISQPSLPYSGDIFYTLSGIAKKDGVPITNATWGDRLLSSYQGRVLKFWIDDTTGQFTITQQWKMKSDWLIHGNIFSYKKGTIVTLEKLKLEKGTIATDYTEAPENVDKAISTVNTKIDTQVAEVNINLGNVTTRVGNTETKTQSLTDASTLTNKKLNDVEGIATTTKTQLAETVISVNNITQRVSSEAQKTLNLESKTNRHDSQIASAQQSIQTTNNKVAEHTISLDGITQRVSNTETTFANFKKIKRNLYPRPTETRNSIGKVIFIDTKDIFANYINKEIKISLDLKCEIARPISIYAYQGRGISINITQDNPKIFTVTTPNIYERFTFTTTIKDWGLNGVGDTLGSIILYDTVGTQNFSISNINLEIEEILEMQEVETRVNSAEQKITPTAILNTINTSINDGTGAINTVYTRLDKDGFTIKNGGLKIKNKAGEEVLKSDIQGNLNISGTFRNKGSEGYDAIRIAEQSITFYDWEKQGYEVGTLATTYDTTTNKRGMSLNHGWEGYTSISYKSDTGNSYYSYISFDKFKKRPDYFSPINITENTRVSAELFCRDAVFIPYALYLGNYIGDNVPQIFRNTSNVLILQNSNTKVLGNFSVTGSKNSLQTTKNYGERLINAYETMEYFHGDLGEGVVNEQGECLVDIDDIVQECINLKCTFHVFTQVYKGKITKIDRHENYFIVYGEPNTTFSWELKAKRIGYENCRHDVVDIGTMDSIANFTDDELKNNTSENALTEVLDFKLESILL